MHEMSLFKRSWFVQSQPVLCMLLVQLFATGNQLLGEVLIKDGMFIFALMTYRHLIATLSIAPLAFFLERGCVKKLSWVAGFWLIASALFGILLAMGMYFYGLKDTTATYSTNFLNLIPIVTFILSSAMGLEKVKLRTRGGILKTLGAILCVSGALCAGLIKVAHFHIGHPSSVLARTTTIMAKQHNWLRGSFLLIGSCLCYSVWFIIQAKLIKVFPYKYWATLLTSIIAAGQSAVVGLCVNRQWTAWRLKWNLELLTIVYLGAFSTAATFCIVNWIIKVKGPTYVPMFNPLSLIFVALLESLILGEELYIGTMLGMVLIIAGLYLFLWGKTKDSKGLVQLIDGDDVASVSTDSAVYAVAVVPSKDIADDEEFTGENVKEFLEVKSQCNV